MSLGFICYNFSNLFWIKKHANCFIDLQTPLLSTFDLPKPPELSSRLHETLKIKNTHVPFLTPCLVHSGLQNVCKIIPNCIQKVDQLGLLVLGGFFFRFWICFGLFWRSCPCKIGLPDRSIFFGLFGRGFGIRGWADFGADRFATPPLPPRVNKKSRSDPS